ncbi:MAG: FABP family protein [Acidobacteria bacterium]|nr:FABP family protein [Acidobacteriota bacterium]
MFVLPEGLPVELNPLAFLVGSWEGVGVVSSKFLNEENHSEQSFQQRVTFSVGQGNYLTYHSTARLIGSETDGSKDVELPAELGFWRLAKPAELADPGPSVLPGTGTRKISSAEDLEALRNDRGGFDIEASIIHPGGAYEFYAGQVKNGRIDMRTVAGSHMPMHLIEAGKGWGYAERMYGTATKDGVNKLFWIMEVASSVRDPLVSLVSVELDRIS